MNNKIVKTVNAFQSALDGNPVIRKALIARIVKAADKAPVVILHQIALMLEISK